jgi:hypothetical protein
MAAWMKAWGSYAPAGQKQSRDDPRQSLFSIHNQTDIVMVLVGMALSCAKEKQGDG